jgi:hypothetical protein
MPYKMSKNKKGGYTVKSPSGTRAKNTTKEKAKAQIRLLQAQEHDEEFAEKVKAKKKTSKKRAKNTSY